MNKNCPLTICQQLAKGGKGLLLMAIVSAIAPPTAGVRDYCR